MRTATLEKFCEKCEKVTTHYRYRNFRRNRGRHYERDYCVLCYRGYDDDILNMYGNVCACCGEKNPFFLTLDHVNNDGYLERKNRRSRRQLFKTVLSNPERFQILCSNCNGGKSRNGGVCPHKTGSVPDWYVADFIYVGSNRISRYALYRHRLKIRVFDFYGNACVCCGEKNPFFLELDHVNNDGYLERRKHTTKKGVIYNRWYDGGQLFRTVLNNPERFQILCSNCNGGKHRNGGVCPHKTGSVADLIYGT
jgi:hypothetical protein